VEPRATNPRKRIFSTPVLMSPQDFVCALKKFANLEQLDITDEQVIDFAELATTSDPDDEDMIDEIMDETIDYALEHPLNEDREDVAMMFFEECPNLRRICFGRPITCDGELFEPVRKNGELVHVQLVDDFDEPPATGHVIEWERDSWPKVMKLRTAI
jgi:hypothetical protein